MTIKNDIFLHFFLSRMSDNYSKNEPVCLKHPHYIRPTCLLLYRTVNTTIHSLIAVYWTYLYRSYRYDGGNINMTEVTPIVLLWTISFYSTKLWPNMLPLHTRVVNRLDLYNQQRKAPFSIFWGMYLVTEHEKRVFFHFSLSKKSSKYF